MARAAGLPHTDSNIGKRIKMHFPFRAAICQHIVSKIEVGKNTKGGAPGSAPFEKSINSGIS
jgi:hypothetical protein